MVKHFADALSKMEGDFDLFSGRYEIDPKSIKGILSLDLSKPIQMNITNAKEGDIEKIKKFYSAKN